jgi:hypothetical protein
MAQVVQYLPSTFEALSSITEPPKKEKEKVGG